MIMIAIIIGYHSKAKAIRSPSDDWHSRPGRQDGFHHTHMTMAWARRRAPFLAVPEGRSWCSSSDLSGHMFI